MTTSSGVGGARSSTSPPPPRTLSPSNVVPSFAPTSPTSESNHSSPDFHRIRIDSLTYRWEYRSRAALQNDKTAASEETLREKGLREEEEEGSEEGLELEGKGKVDAKIVFAMAQPSGVTAEGLERLLRERVGAERVEIEDMSGMCRLSS